MTSDIIGGANDALCVHVKKNKSRFSVKYNCITAMLKNLYNICTAIDIMKPLPITEHGNKYNMVISDYLTKWKEAFALRDHTAL